MGETKSNYTDSANRFYNNVELLSSEYNKLEQELADCKAQYKELEEKCDTMNAINFDLVNEANGKLAELKQLVKEYRAARRKAAITTDQLDYHAMWEIDKRLGKAVEE